jgi:hypothetical protein
MELSYPGAWRRIEKLEVGKEEKPQMNGWIFFFLVS